MSVASRPKKKNPVIFIAVIIFVLLAAIAAIEGLRRLSSSTARTGRSELRPGAADPGYPRELRDGSGATLTLASRPARIVSQTLGSDEILLAICSPDRIAGFSYISLNPQFSPIVDEVRARGIPVARETEEILRLNPDLIFIASYSRAEVVELLQAAGSPVFRFETYQSIEDIKRNIRTIGDATGEQDHAEALVTQMEKELAAALAGIQRPAKPFRVLSYTGGVTAGADTIFDDMMRTVGAVNVAAERGLKGFPRINSEQVTAWDPDFLVCGAYPDEFERTRASLMKDPAIASSRVGRTGRIIIIDNRYYLSVSHHVVRAVEALARGLYSERKDGA